MDGSSTAVVLAVIVMGVLGVASANGPDDRRGGQGIAGRCQEGDGGDGQWTGAAAFNLISIKS